MAVEWNRMELGSNRPTRSSSALRRDLPAHGPLPGLLRSLGGRGARAGGVRVAADGWAAAGHGPFKEERGARGAAQVRGGSAGASALRAGAGWEPDLERAAPAGPEGAARPSLP